MTILLNVRAYKPRTYTIRARLPLYETRSGLKALQKPICAGRYTGPSLEGAKQACEAFKQPGSQWFDEDTYIFIDDTDGTQVCYPPDPSVEGQNQMNLQDSNGTFVVQKIIETVKTEPSGWVEYMWPKPSESADSKKLSYVKKIQSGGKTFIVGSGIYLN